MPFGFPVGILQLTGLAEGNDDHKSSTLQIIYFQISVTITESKSTKKQNQTVLKA